ncbi:AzlC family ABC transporter permease [Syntrophomonas erecta]
MNRKELLDGVRESFPVVLGYLPLGFTFGVLATQAGMTVVQATLMSLLCFTGAGQYIAVGVMQAGGAVITAVVANILVNVRYFLFATSLVPHFRKIKPWIAAGLSYGLTDETYAVAVNRYQNHEATASYMAGLNITSHVGWITSTVLGAVLGTMITNTDRFGLNFALPAMYTCLLIFVVAKKSDVVAAMAAIVISLLIGYFWPSTLANLSNIIFATIIAATLGVILGER